MARTWPEQARRRLHRPSCLALAAKLADLFRCTRVLTVCRTADDPNSPAGCAKKAPGITATFRFEISLFFVRCVLVWVTFGLLYNFDAVEKWAKRREAMRATSDPCAAPHTPVPYTFGGRTMHSRISYLRSSTPRCLQTTADHGDQRTWLCLTYTAPPQKISARLCLTD